MPHGHRPLFACTTPAPHAWYPPLIQKVRQPDLLRAKLCEYVQYGSTLSEEESKGLDVAALRNWNITTKLNHRHHESSQLCEALTLHRVYVIGHIVGGLRRPDAG